MRYEKVSDSGINFFMERLPQGEYTLRPPHEVLHGGDFKTAPATLQSLYAPEFAACSSGRLVTIE